MNDWLKTFLWVALWMIGASVVVTALAYFMAFQEAAAYNRVTGEAVTTWDALWIELRVVNCQ